MNCPSCNTQNKETAKFCMNCGTKLLEEQSVVTPPPLPNTGSEPSVPPPLPPLNPQNPSNQTQSQNIQHQNYTTPKRSNLLPVFLVLGGIVAIIGVIALVTVINENSYNYEAVEAASENAVYESYEGVEEAADAIEEATDAVVEAAEEAVSASDASDVDWSGGYGEEAVETAEEVEEYPDPFSIITENNEEKGTDSEINIDWITRDALKVKEDKTVCYWCGKKIDGGNYVSTYYHRYCSNKCKAEAGE